MNKAKLKIAAYLSLIFVAGAVTGGSIAWNIKEPDQRRGDRGGPRQRPTPDQMCDWVIGKIDQKVGLTAEQKERIRPLLVQGMEEIHAVQKDSVAQVEKVIERTDASIAKELTPEQQPKMEEYIRERREHSKQRGPGGPGPGHRPRDDSKEEHR